MTDTIKEENQDPKTEDPKTEESKTEDPKTEESKDTANDAVMERLDEIESDLKVQLEEKDAQIKELSDEIKRNSRNDQHKDDIVDTRRKSAHLMNLPVIEGAPIVKSEISAVIGVQGLELMAKVVNANGEKFEVPFGCDIKKLDFTSESLKDVYKTPYENLMSEEFELVDIDDNDLTGASTVKKGVIVSEGSLIPEIDRSTGTPIATGRKIKTTVRKDIRHYTIKFNDKNFTLTNEDLANIRI